MGGDVAARYVAVLLYAIDNSHSQISFAQLKIE